jgi:hypothetical protein
VQYIQRNLPAVLNSHNPEVAGSNPAPATSNHICFLRLSESYSLSRFQFASICVQNLGLRTICHEVKRIKNMERAKVFISSVLKRSLEDLQAERDTIRAVVQSHGFLTPWAFEKAPASFEDLDESYLRNVNDCDIFVLLVGREATNPVAAEVQRARQLSKPILAFAKSECDRTPMTQMLLESAGTKYFSFSTVGMLDEAMKDAIDQTLVLVTVWRC